MLHANDTLLQCDNINLGNSQQRMKNLAPKPGSKKTQPKENIASPEYYHRGMNRILLNVGTVALLEELLSGVTLSPTSKG
jgi:hypothetical protein